MKAPGRGKMTNLNPNVCRKLTGSLALVLAILVIASHYCIAGATANRRAGLGIAHDVASARVSSVARPLGGSSVLGDPGMRDGSRVRVALESWDFCNKVGDEGAGLPSPRYADCANLQCDDYTGSCNMQRLVTQEDNLLRSGVHIPDMDFNFNLDDPDEYAIQKELHLGSICEVASKYGPWNFWMVMLKNGNMDMSSGRCPSTAPPPINATETAILAQYHLSTDPHRVHKSSFPCFGKGCMNHPIVYHNLTEVHSNDPSKQIISGSFYGTYDVDQHNVSEFKVDHKNLSYFSVKWEKHLNSNSSWTFHHKLRVNKRYPWLMLYLRADAAHGFSGGYPWETRGMMVKVPESPNFRVKLRLEVIKGGGGASQFYLMDMGGCWKNDGKECDGDPATDVTRYSEMIINPSTGNWCHPGQLASCPPYHVDALTGERIHRNDTQRFPYGAYHYHCVPSNAAYPEKPFETCDTHSNPIPQELLQILPHPAWAPYGYPSSPAQAWVGQPATSWDLDVGALSHNLYFYQDPRSPPAIRRWPSLDVGTEIFNSPTNEEAEWILSDFDVLLTEY